MSGRVGDGARKESAFLGEALLLGLGHLFAAASSKDGGALLYYHIEVLLPES
jgi:hypothetical protein